MRQNNERKRSRLIQMRPLFVGRDDPDDIDLLDDIPEIQFEDTEIKGRNRYNYFSWEF